MLKKRILPTLSILAIITMICTALSKFHWTFDMIAHFRVYYWLAFVGLTALAIYLKERTWIISNLLFVVLIGIGFTKFYIPRFEVTGNDFRICSMNVLSTNRDFQKALDVINEEDPAILVIQELSPPWVQQFKALDKKYPYQKLAPQNGNFGLGIYSKFPMSNTEIKMLCDVEIPTIITDIEIDNKTITVIGTHPTPPLLHGFYNRNTQFRNLNKLVKEQKNPVILTGDLNCTSFSYSLNLLTDGANLKDTRLGFGLQPTWSSDIPLVNIPIDHCFISEELKTANRRVGNSTGSDHHPIIVDIGWKYE